jgi:hypothetical protein
VLAFGGDVHFEGVLSTKLAADASSVLAPIAPVLSRADLAVVNLETAVTNGGSPAAKTYTFRTPASAFAALRGGGVDVASMANNHGMDFGAAGLRDSLAAARRYRFPVVGIGVDDRQAYAPYRRTVNGQRIAVLGATQVLDDHLISAWTAGPGKPGLASAKDVPRLLRAVRQARATSDTVVVFLHWGVELMRTSWSEVMRTGCRARDGWARRLSGTASGTSSGTARPSSPRRPACCSSPLQAAASTATAGCLPASSTASLARSPAPRCGASRRAGARCAAAPA